MKCAECLCTQLDCRDFECSACTKEVCCCDSPKQHSIQILQKCQKFVCDFISNRSLMHMCSFILFGYRTVIGITLRYILGYALSAFTTFATILGRSIYSENTCSCCSVLEQGSNGFIATLLTTFKKCSIGAHPQLRCGCSRIISMQPHCSLGYFLGIA